jgi:hypothetical protein
MMTFSKQAYSIFSRKKDMNYKVLKTEAVYSKNILNI